MPIFFLGLSQLLIRFIAAKNQILGLKNSCYHSPINEIFPKIATYKILISYHLYCSVEKMPEGSILLVLFIVVVVVFFDSSYDSDSSEISQSMLRSSHTVFISFFVFSFYESGLQTDFVSVSKKEKCKFCAPKSFTYFLFFWKRVLGKVILKIFYFFLHYVF